MKQPDKKSDPSPVAKQLNAAVDALKRNHPELKGPAAKLIREAMRHPEHAKTMAQVLEGCKQRACVEKAMSNRLALAAGRQQPQGLDLGRRVADSVRRALENRDPSLVRLGGAAPKLKWERDEKAIHLNTSLPPKKRR